jgi:CheY-like chemotaxis protein
MQEPYILLVDDNKSIRDCLIWVFDDERYSVITASNGKDALELLEKNPSLPDFILLDLMMPIMNGWQFRELQQLNPRFKNIPTVILSAKINIAEQTFYSNEYLLPKPFDIEDLLVLIKMKKTS